MIVVFRNARHATPRRLRPVPLGRSVRSPRRLRPVPLGRSVRSPRRLRPVPLGRSVRSPRRLRPVPLGRSVRSPRRLRPVPLGRSVRSPRRLRPVPLGRSVRSPRRLRLVPLGRSVRSPRRLRPVPLGRSVRSSRRLRPVPRGRSVRSPMLLQAFRPGRLGSRSSFFLPQDLLVAHSGLPEFRRARPIPRRAALTNGRPDRGRASGQLGGHGGQHLSRPPALSPQSTFHARRLSSGADHEERAAPKMDTELLKAPWLPRRDIPPRATAPRTKDGHDATYHPGRRRHAPRTATT
jgi:hypothetical protein